MARSCYSYPGLRSLLRIPLHRDDAIRWSRSVLTKLNQWERGDISLEKKFFFFPRGSKEWCSSVRPSVRPLRFFFIFRSSRAWGVRKSIPHTFQWMSDRLEKKFSKIRFEKIYNFFVPKCSPAYADSKCVFKSLCDNYLKSWRLIFENL